MFGSGRNFLKSGHTTRALYSRLGEFERFHNELPVTSKLAEQLPELPAVAEDLAQSRKRRFAKPRGHAAKDPVTTTAAKLSERVPAARVPRALSVVALPPAMPQLPVQSPGLAVTDRGRILSSLRFDAKFHSSHIPQEARRESLLLVEISLSAPAPPR